MQILVFGLLILVGFVAGYFFKVAVLITLSVLCIAVAAYLIHTMQEMAKIITAIFIAGAVIANAAMWVTYYKVATQTFIGDFLHTYVLR